MNQMTQAAETKSVPTPLSANETAFALAQRQAMALSQSALVPKEYQGNVANCLVALEIAHRTGASPLMVAQNLHVIHGRPSWSSQFIIAALNSCGRFSPLRFKKTDGACMAWAIDKESGETLEGPTVTMAMAKAEGWSTKNGSKWLTMPELMLMYRSAAFFGRLYAPDVLMGMHTADEVEDVYATQNRQALHPPETAQARPQQPSAYARIIDSAPAEDAPEADPVDLDPSLPSDPPPEAPTGRPLPAGVPDF